MWRSCSRPMFCSGVVGVDVCLVFCHCGFMLKGINVDAGLHRRLKVLAAERGVSVRGLVEGALVALLDAHVVVVPASPRVPTDPVEVERVARAHEKPAPLKQRPSLGELNRAQVEPRFKK